MLKFVRIKLISFSQWSGVSMGWSCMTWRPLVLALLWGVTWWLFILGTRYDCLGWCCLMRLRPSAGIHIGVTLLDEGSLELLTAAQGFCVEIICTTVEYTCFLFSLYLQIDRLFWIQERWIFQSVVKFKFGTGRVIPWYLLDAMLTAEPDFAFSDLMLGELVYCSRCIWKFVKHDSLDAMNSVY